MSGSTLSRCSLLRRQPPLSQTGEPALTTAYYATTITTSGTSIIEVTSPTPSPMSTPSSSSPQSGWVYATAILATILGVSIFLLLVIFGYVKPKRWKRAGAAEKEKELEELITAGKQKLKEHEHESNHLMNDDDPRGRDGDRDRDRGRYAFLGNGMRVPLRMPMAAASMPMGGPGMPWEYW